MSMSVDVETVEKGDRIEVPFKDGIAIGVIQRIVEGPTNRSFELTGDDDSFVWGVARGDSVNLVC